MANQTTARTRRITHLIPRVGPTGCRIELVSGGPDALIDGTPHRHLEGASTPTHRAYTRAQCCVCGNGIYKADVCLDGIPADCFSCAWGAARIGADPTWPRQPGERS